MIKCALISVTDKNKLEKIAKLLFENGVKIISTGGTEKFLIKQKIDVINIENVTNFPEILDGRVKTLHPKIYGGILYRRNLKKDELTIKKENIISIDLVIVNLYKFHENIKNQVSEKKIIESIDIGGPSLIRATAKNYHSTTILVDPEDYEEAINQIKKKKNTTLSFRKYLARKAFKATYKYDQMIHQWFNKKELENKAVELSDNILLNLSKGTDLRYGENPHQKGGYYTINNENKISLSSNQIQGKELSYNNINDINAALNLICEFEKPTAVIIKHANPCGVSEASEIKKAWKNAVKSDPISAFGGVVAVNRSINKNLAQSFSKIFLEVIIAPSITRESQKILSKKKNLRIIIIKKLKTKNQNMIQIKTVIGGVLLQTKDNSFLKKKNLKIVTKRKPNIKELNDLLFAWKVAKHTMSNAIIFAKNTSTTGIGAGQMSRIDSAYIAKLKSKKSSEIAKIKNMTIGSVVASDAFFPFPDALISISEAGATAVIQPGGSIRDEKIIEEANNRNIAMVFTNVRNFKH